MRVLEALYLQALSSKLLSTIDNIWESVCSGALDSGGTQSTRSGLRQAWMHA